MKKVIISTMFFAALTVSAHAQTGKPQFTEEQKKELKAKLDAYKEKLNFSDEQKSKVEEVNMEYMEALSKIKEDGGSRMSRYKKFKQANNNRDKKMKEILTKEQYKIYKEHQEEFKEELRARRAKG
jgi:Spy/CpxP family protein refolding chaperone